MSFNREYSIRLEKYLTKYMTINFLRVKYNSYQTKSNDDVIYEYLKNVKRKIGN